MAKYSYLLSNSLKSRLIFSALTTNLRCRRHFNKNFEAHLTFFTLPNQCETQPSFTNSAPFDIVFDLLNIISSNIKPKIGYLQWCEHCHYADIKDLIPTRYSLCE